MGISKYGNCASAIFDEQSGARWLERLTHEDSAYLETGYTLQMTKMVYNRINDGNKPDNPPVTGTTETRPLLVGRRGERMI